MPTIEGMGILDRLGIGRSTNLLRTARQLRITSPYAAPPDLPPILVTDLLSEEELELLPLSRAQAIGIPAVSKARNLLVSAIAKFPLRAYKGAELVKNQPTFLYRSDSPVTPYERMAWTVDDLIFHGCSLWALKRGARAPATRFGPILDAEWVPHNQWQITYDEAGNGHIMVDEQDVADDEVILFNSPFEGLLNIGNTTLKGALATEKAWVGRMRNPIPALELRVTEDQLTETEVEDLVAAWAAARRSENGAVGATPPGVELHTHGELKHELFTEGRNAIRTDIGSLLNIRSSMLDGTHGIDSLTYTTELGERNLFYEIDLPFWTDPIEARLSMDDVVPRGQRVRFDKYEAFNPPSPTGPTVED